MPPWVRRQRLASRRLWEDRDGFIHCHSCTGMLSSVSELAKRETGFGRGVAAAALSLMHRCGLLQVGAAR